MPIDKEPWWDIEERRIKESKQDVPKKRSSKMFIKWLILLFVALMFFAFLYYVGGLWFLGL